jgi:hypothetical protein
MIYGPLLHPQGATAREAEAGGRWIARSEILRATPISSLPGSGDEWGELFSRTFP